MTSHELGRIWANEYVKTVIMAVLIVVAVFGFWYGSQLVLNTPYPALAVASGSMCTFPGPHCDGWTHPFEPTLHVGDLIIVQGVGPQEIRADSYPYGDIIVFQQQFGGDELIVHRAIAKEERDGMWYFQTKGDGNQSPDSITPNIQENRVIGKVVLRIPWVGHIALFMHNSSGMYIVIILVVILVVVEILIPTFSSKEPEVSKTEGSQSIPGT